MFAESLFGGLEVELATSTCVHGKYRRTRKTKQVITLEFLYNGCVHISELASVALVEDKYDMLAIDFVRPVLANEHRELLYGSDDDACLRVFQLTFQHGSAGVAVCRPFLEAVVFLHGLVVQVLAVHHEQHFVNILHAACQPCCLE